MIEHFETLEDIWADSLFDELIAQIKPQKIERHDPELEKFQEILAWVETQGCLPKRTTNLMERKLYSRLQGILTDEDKLAYFKPYDSLNILGGAYD